MKGDFLGREVCPNEEDPISPRRRRSKKNQATNQHKNDKPAKTNKQNQQETNKPKPNQTDKKQTNRKPTQTNPTKPQTNPTQMPPPGDFSMSSLMLPSSLKLRSFLPLERGKAAGWAAGGGKSFKGLREDQKMFYSVGLCWS